MRTALTILTLSASAALALTACGEDTIRADGAEKTVANVVAEQTTFRPTDVQCPEDQEAKVGGTFDCTFTGPEPKPYVAHVRITKVDGEKVVFYVRSVPAG